MSVSHILDNSTFSEPQTVPIVATCIRGGILFNIIKVPIGTSTYSIPITCSTVICLSGETLSSVTWTLPLASSCPGLQISIINKSTSTTITLATVGGNYLPSYLSPPTIPPSGGSSNDQFFYFQSDGIDTWQ